MSRVSRTLRQTLTIARRDFIATVFTPIFLLFLFAPVIMGSFGAIGGLGAASVADGGPERSRIVAIVPVPLARPIAEVDTRLRGVFRPDEQPPGLTTLAPAANAAAQAHAAFRARDYDAAAVLYGPLDRPHILYGARGDRAAEYLVTLAQATLAAQRLGGALPVVTPVRIPVVRAAPTRGGRHQSAFFAVFGIFFLTLFLAGQVVGTMAEERNNKVIEILAAAVPLESVFLGKLLGMFGVAVLFVAFWATVVGQIGMLMPPSIHGALGELRPAVGTPVFTGLFIVYFTMAYLLLGSVFLAVGAQATTPREIQMLSLPITILQVAMFALASAAVHAPGSWVATLAETFPLSSPFAMAGHAANAPGLWPHAAAIAWQALWVAIFIAIGARMFRRGVLQSGSARPRWRRAKAN
ncbi:MULTISPECIES: ABC transporter permease [unclassified Sphingomonas]|uniref:ABC transporter permease n=1 Tax=unclassified Sphingomonas TaxID=196159 RepID=UPI001F580B9F|nr:MULTISPECIES: ABC transporter permease [unclassified Sphingomonas]